MNKVFKIVWNAATQSWVAVSELTKAHKKQSAVKNIAKLSVLATSVIAGGAVAASAADGLIQINSTGAATATGADAIAAGNNASSTAEGGIAIGKNAKIETPTQSRRENPTDSIAIGTDAEASAQDAIVIGRKAKALQTGLAQTSANGAISIGTESSASYKQAVSLGYKTQANWQDSVAIGANAVANGVPKPNASGVLVGASEAATSIGASSQATGNGSTALGSVAQATGDRSVAIGRNALSTNERTIALGSYANANTAYAIAIGSNNQTSTDSAQALSLGAIAIGTNSTAKRSDSLDANSPYSGFNGYYAISIGYASNASNMAATAFGYNAKANGIYSSALGPSSTVAAKDSSDNLDLNGGTALGHLSNVTVTRGVALGSKSVADQHARTGFNPSAQQTTNSHSISRANASVDPTVTETFTATDTRLNTYAGLKDNVLKATLAAVSVGSSTNTRQINHVAAGYADDDAVNVAQLRSVNLKIAGNTVAGAEPSNGAESKADVLLDSQTLTVKSADTALLTTDATNNTITLTPNTQSVSVTNGAATTPTSNGLVTATSLATTLQNLYWTATSGKTTGENTGSSNARIAAGGTVSLIAGDNVTIAQTGNQFVFSVKDVVKTIDKNTGAENFFKAGDNLKVSTDNGVVTYSLQPSISVDQVTINGDNKTSITDGAVNNLKDHLDTVTDKTTSVTTPTALTTGPNAADTRKQAATVNDVLNAGWNLQANGEAVDAVTHGNTVDFRAEEGTGLTITKDSDGNKSTITVGNKYSKVNSTKDVASATGTDAVAVGPNAKADAASSVALGDDSHVTSEAAAGSVAIGKGATAGAAHTGDYRLDGSTDVAGKTGADTRVVSVGKEGDEAQIQNVAPGVVSATSTDAVNGSQLYAVAKSITDNNANITNVNNRINGLDNKVNRMNKDLRAGIAGANAAAGLPQVYQPGKSMVAAAAGTFKGQHAVAVGYSRATDNGKVIFKMQGNANSRGDVGGSVGVGYQW